MFWYEIKSSQRSFVTVNDWKWEFPENSLKMKWTWCVCGTLRRVHKPLCHSELTNNSERPVWFLCMQLLWFVNWTSKVWEFFFLNIERLLNRYLRIEVIIFEFNGEGRVPNIAGKRCLQYAEGSYVSWKRTAGNPW